MKFGAERVELKISSFFPCSFLFTQINIFYTQLVLMLSFSPTHTLNFFLILMFIKIKPDVVMSNNFSQAFGFSEKLQGIWYPDPLLSGVNKWVCEEAK